MITPYIEKISLPISPREAFLRLQHLSGLLFLEGNSNTSDFAFITADPFEVLEYQASASQQQQGDILKTLKNEYRRWKIKPCQEVPPFQGGIAGLFGYGLSKQLEKLPLDRSTFISSPDLSIGFYDWVLSFDLKNKQVWLVSTGFPETTEHLRTLKAKNRAEMVLNLLKTPAKDDLIKFTQKELSYDAPDNLFRLFEDEHFFCDNSANDYIKSVEKSIEYINAGDSFQINLSQRFWHPKFCDDRLLYEILSNTSPAPFSCYLPTSMGNILSASPERFLTLRDNKVITSPIKGTRPRGKTEKEDSQLAASLLNSPKDRAENVMIVDLLRNDLGRVCSFGSIQVEELCKLETYSNVHHLVSKVTGRLKPEYDALDLLLSCFPGGSVTGAPKIRSMEIISELETSPRGIYCGSAGYLGFDGSMDTNILIRSIFSSGKWLQFGAGGGIVADSKPEDEYLETLNKASGIIKAIRSHPDSVKLFQR